MSNPIEEMVGEKALEMNETIESFQEKLNSLVADTPEVRSLALVAIFRSEDGTDERINFGVLSMQPWELYSLADGLNRIAKKRFDEFLAGFIG